MALYKPSIKRACLRALRTTFGLQAYRPGQKAAAHALLSGRDVLCILPTGAGKSLCWQLPAVVHEGLTLVVSPLIALMRDQVQHLQAVGVPAVALHGLMTDLERQTTLESLLSGAVRILFVAPERLNSRALARLFAAHPPWLVVVDEAHCAVQWGQAFRPAYAAIPQFLHALPERPVLCAMTATADRAMQRSILSLLAMRRPKRLLLPVLRDNLVYEVRTTLDPTREIIRLTAGAPGKTVVFCRSRKRTERLAACLQQHGILAEHYHAGMERKDRDGVQQRFQLGETEVLAATSAFGMGVDIPDIRRVIHDELPDSLTDYVQQSGRAGRDGRAAFCILLLTPNGILRQGDRLRAGYRQLRFHPIRQARFIRDRWRPLRQLLQTVLTADCIPGAIARVFGGRAGKCGVCSACKQGPLNRSIPDLPRQTRMQTIAYFLRWQRDAIAREQGATPAAVLSDQELSEAARRLILPPSAGVHAGRMQRLLTHFQHGGTHENGGDGISCIRDR